MSHLLPCRLHLRSRVATLPAIKGVETETIPRNRAPIGRRNSLRAMRLLLRHDTHSPRPLQLLRSGRPATITGQRRASPSHGPQRRNGRKHRLGTATQALDRPPFQRRNPSRLRRTRIASASQRTTNTRQLVQSTWEGEPVGSPDFCPNVIQPALPVAGDQLFAKLSSFGTPRHFHGRPTSRWRLSWTKKGGNDFKPRKTTSALKLLLTASSS